MERWNIWIFLYNIIVFSLTFEILNFLEELVVNWWPPSLNETKVRFRAYICMLRLNCTNLGKASYVLCTTGKGLWPHCFPPHQRMDSVHLMMKQTIWCLNISNANLHWQIKHSTFSFKLKLLFCGGTILTVQTTSGKRCTVAIVWLLHTQCVLLKINDNNI